MEEIRKSDPARYTWMTNHSARIRMRQLARAQGKLDILASVDTTRLSPQQKHVHEQYQDLIARQEDLRSVAFAPLDDAAVTDEQRAAAHAEMREVGQRLHNLAHQERETLLDQTARAFGLTGDAAQDLVETVKAVYQATEAWGRRGPGPGGPGGPPPPPQDRSPPHSARGDTPDRSHAAAGRWRRGNALPQTPPDSRDSRRRRSPGCRECRDGRCTRPDGRDD